MPAPRLPASLRRTATALTLFLGALTPSLTHAGTVGGNLSVSSRGTSSASFAVGGAGKIEARATAPAQTALELTLVGPSGAVVATGTGTGSASVSFEVTSAALAQGRLYRVEAKAPRVDPRSAVNVSVTATYPGIAVTAEALRTLPEAAAKSVPVQRVIRAANPATPAPKPAAEVTRGVLATFKGSLNAAAIGKAPVKIGPLSQAAPKPPSGSDASGSGYGPPPSGVRYPPIAGVNVNGTHACTGWGTCTVRKGDTVILSGQNFNGIPDHKVTFFFFDSNKEVTVDVVGWSDTLVVATVPDIAGTPDQSAAVYIGAPGASNVSSPFGLFYQRKLVTQYLDFWGSNFGPSIMVSNVWQAKKIGSMATTNIAYLGLGDTTPFYARTVRPITWTEAGTDTILAGAHLKNGWIVKRVVVGTIDTLAQGASIYVHDSHEGTNDPSVAIDFSIPVPASVTYVVAEELEGEEGTAPYDTY